MQWRAGDGLTEASMAWAMDNEERRKQPPMRRLHPNSTAGAPNGQSRVKMARCKRGATSTKTLARTSLNPWTKVLQAHCQAVWPVAWRLMPLPTHLCVRLRCGI